jgi:hypothetical protein
MATTNDRLVASHPAARTDRLATPWTRLAGLLLIVDGAFVVLLGLVAFAVFRPVAAIEGRESPDQAPYPLLVLALLLAVAFLWAGQRAIRGIRRGRIVGMLLALVLGLLFASPLLSSGMSPSEVAFAIGVVAVQAVIVVVLARWPSREALRA